MASPMAIALCLLALAASAHRDSARSHQLGGRLEGRLGARVREQEGGVEDPTAKDSSKTWPSVGTLASMAKRKKLSAMFQLLHSSLDAAGFYYFLDGG